MNARSVLNAAVLFALLLCAVRPAAAQDAQRGLAPADEYFGHYKLSVLGIANAIRDAGARVGSGADAQKMIDGPLSYVADAIRDWEGKYPSDPWIPKDLLALEIVYLQAASDDGFRMASKTEAWLAADYPRSEQAAQGREELADNHIPYMPQQNVAQRSYAPPPDAYQPPQTSYQAPPAYQPAPPVQVFNTYSTVYTAPPPARTAIPSYAIPWDRYTAMHAAYVPYVPYAPYVQYRR